MKAQTLINKLQTAADKFEKLHGVKPTIYSIDSWENKITFCKRKVTRGGITTAKKPYMYVTIKGLDDIS